MAKKNEVQKLRDQADKMLSPLIRKLFPRCLLCNEETQVAHHHIHKSSSTRLRYYLPNLINLCHKCHCKLHHNESQWASEIVRLKGLDWYEDLRTKRNEMVKADKFYYQNAIEELKML